MYYTDDVKGIIVGSDTYTGYVYYDGRKQSQAIVGYTEQEMLVLCDKKIQALKDEYNCFPTYLYLDDTLWSIRVSI